MRKASQIDVFGRSIYAGGRWELDGKIVKTIEVPNYRDENKPVVVTFQDDSTVEIMTKEYMVFYDKPEYKIIGGKKND